MVSKYFYHKRDIQKIRLIIRYIGLIIFLTGIFGLLYVFFPLVSWQVYLVPQLASQDIISPIPDQSVLSSTSVSSLFQSSIKDLGVNYSNANNWFPGYAPQNSAKSSSVHVFYLSIPTLGIYHATVSNADNDLDHHLVNYAGTASPPEKGNTVIFGHSTLPQWFNPHNYKAIFATALNLKLGDKIIATVNGADYTYIIDNISIVNADDYAPLEQQYDNSYMTIITCTPPGTTWKRLVIHSHLAKLVNTSLQ